MVVLPALRWSLSPLFWVAALLSCTHRPEPEVPDPDSTRDSASDSGLDSGLPTVPVDSSVDSGPPPVTYAHVAVLKIDTAGVGIGDAAKTDATLTVVRDHDGTLTDLDTAPVDAIWPIGIEIHGSSSSGYPKLPYRFECRDETGEDASCGLLDMPGASDWVLHAPYSDKTLVRNAFAYAQAREIAETAGGGDGFPTGEWQPRSDFVEVFLNGAYQGVYLLVERAQRDDDRLDMEKPAVNPTEGDVSGGYVVKIDAGRSEGWQTAAGTIIDYHQPHADAITAPQVGYLRGWFDEFEQAMAADTWQDPTLGYPSRIVTAAWVDYILQNEVANNIDSYRLSTYLYKDQESVDTRLHVGPVWDFDRAYGDVNYCDAWNTYGWVTDELTACGYRYQYPFWWLKLLVEPGMQTAERCRWDALRQGPLADTAMSARLDALVAKLDEAEPRDHALWGTIGVYVEPNIYVGASYVEEVEWLRAWMVARAAWMDTNLPGVCPS